MGALLIWCVCAAAEAEPPAFFAGNEELRGYLLEAGEHHPGLWMRFEEWLAALERIPQAKALDDPMLTYGHFLQSETNRFKVMLSQKIPWFGTRRLRGEKAAAEAEAALARLYAERNRIFADVKRRYYEYAYLRESIQVVESQASVLEYVEATVQALYALGLAEQSDVLRAQMARSQLGDRVEALRQYRPALSAQLTEALGREGGEVLPWPQEAGFPLHPPSAEVVRARIREANPGLAALEHVTDGRRKQIALARKKGFPDFTFGIEFVSVSKARQIRPDRPYPSSLYALDREVRGMWDIFTGTAGTTTMTGMPLIDLYSVATAEEPMAYSDGGEDNVMVSVQMNLPIWRGRVRAGIREAEHLEQAALHERSREANALDAAAEKALYGIADAERRLKFLHDTLLVQAGDVFESLQTEYATGLERVTFLEVLGSVDRLLELELEQTRVARDLHIAAADLEQLMGGPWEVSEVSEEEAAEAAEPAAEDSAVRP